MSADEKPVRVEAGETQHVADADTSRFVASFGLSEGKPVYGVWLKINENGPDPKTIPVIEGMTLEQVLELHDQLAGVLGFGR